MTDPVRVLFFTHSARAFSSSLIGHLYEVSQQYPVVLLTEPLPEAYSRHVLNKSLFPRLERVHTVNCLGFTVRALVRENRRWLRLAREALDTFTPSVVIGENDMSSLFDMYLLREAKRRGLPCLTVQAMGEIPEFTFRKFAELRDINRNGEEPSTPVALWRQTKRHLRKNFGHLLVHYLLPWFTGEPALRGRSSYVRRTGAPGMRDSDLHLVQSTPQHRLFIDSGVSSNRIAILGHPAHRVPQEAFFPAGTSANHILAAGRRQMLVLMTSLDFGFERGTLGVISPHRRRQVRLDILGEIGRNLPDWRLIVKAHPDFGSIQALKKYLGPLPDNVMLVPPSDPVEPLLPMCDAVMDLPPPHTSALVTASSAFPEMPVIAADLDHDLIGDQFRDWPEIDYVEDFEVLTKLLRTIRDGAYTKASPDQSASETVRRFENTNQAVSFILERYVP